MPRKTTSRRPKATKAERFLRSRGFNFTPDDAYSMSMHMTLFLLRDEHIARFGFAILTSETVERLRPYSPILEVGSGSGYWAYELKRAGIDVVATDPCTGRYGTVNGHWDAHKWTKPIEMTGEEAVRAYPGRTLLIVWPDHAKDWAAKTLAAYTGRHVLYVGEGYGGCTADDTFHEMLEHDYNQLENVYIPQFFGLHDWLEIWERKE